MKVQAVELSVYNLEFRPLSMRLEVAGYTFDRIPNYSEQQAKLQHLLSSHDHEFSIKANTGGHAHTAILHCPDNCPPPVIPWQDPESSALDDILLLLRLFTGRDVFVTAEPDLGRSDIVITADPRVYRWGGVLSCSIPYECREFDDPYKTIDTSHSVHLPRIYARMQDENWQRNFKNGFFLVLLSQAIKQRLLEAAFGQCWTIWEHLFACLTDSWISRSGNRQLNAKEKIAFLLIHFGVRVELDDSEKTRLDDLVAIRNRLIHYGQFPERDAVRSDAEMFIHMTEFIAAKALGLYPSNVFGTIEGLDEFLSNTPNRGE